MARPSRGASRGSDSAAVCPSGALLTLDGVAPDEWDLEASWTPDVAATDAITQWSLDGITWADDHDDQNPTNPFDTIINPLEHAGPGDTLYVRIRITGLANCPDITTNTVSGDL